MRKVCLIFIIFLFSSLVWGQQVESEDTVKGQLLSGLDQLEDLMLDMSKSITSLQGDVAVGQQVAKDMTSIREAQAAYLNQLREQIEEMDKLDKAKSQYIVLMQSRQQTYRIALAIGIPAGMVVGVAGGLLLAHLFK